MSKTLIKQYYRLGLFTYRDLIMFVSAGYITSDEIEEMIKTQGIKEVND